MISTLVLAVALLQRQEPPTEWIDPDTGHRVVRLSTQPGSASLYFNYNGYTADGSRLVFSTPDGISAVDLKTHRITSVVQGKVRLLFVGRRTSFVYYSRPDRDTGTAPVGSGTIYAAEVDTGKSREVARVDRGSIGSINADETLLAGTSAQRDAAVTSGEKPRVGPDGKPLTYADSKEMGLDERLEAHIPMELFTVNLRRESARSFSAPRTGSTTCSSRRRIPVSSCSATRALGTRWTASGRSARTVPG